MSVLRQTLSQRRVGPGGATKNCHTPKNVHTTIETAMYSHLAFFVVRERSAVRRRVRGTLSDDSLLHIADNAVLFQA